MCNTIFQKNEWLPERKERNNEYLLILTKEINKRLRLKNNRFSQ